MRDDRGATLPALALTRSRRQMPAVPDGLVIRRVADEAGLDDHYAIVVEAFGLPLEFARGVMPARRRSRGVVRWVR